jgi:hypothetical protein
MCSNCTEGLKQPYERIVEIYNEASVRNFLKEIARQT